MARIRTVSLLFLAVVAGQVPFLNQAVHIDDRIYLELADNVLRKPLFPYDFPAVYEGFEAPDSASHSHLPLLSYYLAFWKAVTGSSAEWIFHMAFLIFPLLAAYSFYDWARHYVRYPLAASLLLVFSPAFFTLSHTLMTDVPFLAFWLLAVSRFMRLVPGPGRRRDWVLCAVGLLGTAFISLLGGALALLLAVYLVLWMRSGEPGLSGRRVRLLALLLVLPLLLWLLWYGRAYLHYGRFVLLDTFQHLHKRQAFTLELLGLKGLSLLLNLGAVALFPLCAWYAWAGRWSARGGLLLFFLAYLPFYTWVQGWNFLQASLFALFLSSGVVTVWGCLRLVRSRVGSLALLPTSAAGPWQGEQVRWLLAAFWLVGMWGAYLLLFYAGSARYALLSFPPLLLFWIAALEMRVKETFFRRNLIWSALWLTLPYSLAVAWADAQLADLYRRQARQIVRDYEQPGRTIWVTAEWGFRYYMLQSGARLLTKTGNQPEAEDLIVKPYLAMPWVTLYDSPDYVQLLEQRPADLQGSLRILDFRSHAGFYSTGWGLLPVSWGDGEPWEWFNIFRVRKRYRGPIPEQERPW